MTCSGAIWNDVGHICHVDNCKWAYIGIVNPDHDSHSPSRWTATDLAKLNILSGAQSWFFDKPELDIQNLPISHSVLNISIDSGPIEGDFEASRFVRYLRHAMNAKEGESRVDDLMAEVLRLAGFYEHETLHVVRQKNELLIAGGVLFNAIPDLAIHGIEVNGTSFPRLVVENKVIGSDYLSAIPQLVAEGISAAQQYYGKAAQVDVFDILGIMTIGASPIFFLLQYTPRLVDCVRNNESVPPKTITGSAHYFIPVDKETDIPQYFKEGMANLDYRRRIFYYLLAFKQRLFNVERQYVLG